MCSATRFLFPLSFVVVVSTFGRVSAELPLPEATLYGQVRTTTGAPVASGTLRARVQRGGAVREFEGEFKSADGADWYVIRIPLETSIGAPGPSGVAAREGDSLAAILLDGTPISPASPLGTLVSGSVRRVDGTTDGPAGLVYIRGDCSPDGVVNITDPVRVLNYLFASSVAPPCLEACDSDGSGVLNITDAIFSLGFLFLGGPAPPPPGPSCGVDPSPSTLGCESSGCV